MSKARFTSVPVQSGAQRLGAQASLHDWHDSRSVAQRARAQRVKHAKQTPVAGAHLAFCTCPCQNASLAAFTGVRRFLGLFEAPMLHSVQSAALLGSACF